MNTDKVTATMVAESDRMDVTGELFGTNFPLQLEPVIFGLADHLSKDYHGGSWDFYRLSNGGFYMAPEAGAEYHVVAENYFEGDMTADALGITACLYAYSNLSFGDQAIAEVYGKHYHLLRAFMMNHPEVDSILRATD